MTVIINDFQNLEEIWIFCIQISSFRSIRENFLEKMGMGYKILTVFLFITELV